VDSICISGAGGDGSVIPTIGFATAASLYDEASGTVQIPVVLSVAAADTVTVDYTVTGGTATKGADFTATDGTLTFGPGDTQQTIAVAIVADGIEEPSETIELALRSPTGGVIGASAHEVTISANILPRVTFTTDTSSTPESTATMIVVTLDTASTIPVSVDYTLSGTATGGGTDYSLAAGTVTFPAGVTTQQLAVGEVNDALDEDDETVVVTLTNPSNVIIGATSVRTHTLTDDDAPPSVGFMTMSFSSSESTMTATFNVTLSAVSGRTVTVPFAKSGGNATDPADYSYGTASPLVFPAGTTTLAITLTVVDDALDEDDETVQTSLGTPTNASLGSSTRTLTITDNDPRPTVSFNFATSSRDEDVGTTTFTVSLSTASGRTVTVPFSATGGTASNPADYSYGTSSPLTFSPGTTSRMIDVDIVDDTLVEGDETVDTTLGTPTNATLGSIPTRTLTIVDND
jgi:hypothetical protein